MTSQTVSGYYLLILITFFNVRQHFFAGERRIFRFLGEKPIAMIAKSSLFILFMVLPGVVICQSGRENSGNVPWSPLALYNAEGKIRPLNSGCGIYSTSEDRKIGQLSFSIDCSNESHRLKKGFVGDRSAIRIVRQDKTYDYLKSQLYGYRDCSGSEYHFYDGKSYELVNPGEPIAIYRTYAWAGKQRLTKYFYAHQRSGPIKSLTLRNLESDFKGDALFLEKLGQLAKNDFELIRFRHAINLIAKSTNTCI